MAKYKRKGKPRKNLEAQKNKISCYFSPKTDEKIVTELIEDLVLTSPQLKRRKIDTSMSPTKTPNKTVIMRSSLTSPAKKKSPLRMKNKVVNKVSPRKSARNLFGLSPRCPPIENKRLESLSTDSLDMNANLSSGKEMNVKNPRKRKYICSSEKFIEKCDSDTDATALSNAEKNFVAQVGNGTTKLIASEFSISETPSDRMDICKGLNYFKDITKFLQSSFNQPERRLKVNFHIETAVPENGPIIVDSGKYSESLMAILQAPDFSDTSLDYARNFLNHEPYLSWKFLKQVVYFSLDYCSEEDFTRAVKLCFHQLTQHPPNSSHMREYYGLLLNNLNGETMLGEKSQKGLLTYLMDAFAEHYQYSIASETKRKPVTNKRYLNDTLHDISDEDDTAMQVDKKSLKKKDRKNVESKIFMGGFLGEMGLEDRSTKSQEGINDFLCNALSNIDSKNRVIMDSNIIIERQFKLLDFVVRIFEYDIVLWHKKNTLRAREKLVSTDGGPIIAFLMWDRQLGFSFMSTRLKQLFHFYANCDSKHRKYFERFIAVVAEVMRVFDGYLFEENEKEFVNYPYIGENCKNFSCEFFEYFQKLSANSQAEVIVNEQISRLKSLQPSWLKLLVANELLDQTLGSKFSGNLSSVIDVLKAYSYDYDSPCSQESLTGSSGEGEELSQTQRTKLRSKTDINQSVNKLGETSLHVACKRKKHGELKNFLQLPNVSIMVADNNGWLPIHEAAFHGSVECCKLLYNHASTIESKFALLASRSKDDSTPLLEAVNKNHIEVADYLLSVGGVCLLKHVNNSQCSPFDLCSSDEMKQVLMKYQNQPAKKFLRISPEVFKILFALVSAYFATYGTDVCFKHEHLNLSPADFNNVFIANENGNPVSFLLDSSLYINDLKIISQIQALIEFLQEHNPDVKELKALHEMFS